MSDSVRDLLVRGIAAAKSKEIKEACHYLDWALLSGDISTDQRIDALYWRAQVEEDKSLKRGYLEDVLAYQPFHSLARREIMILDGKLNPGDVIDPNRVVVPAGSQEEQQPKLKSFSCPNCGGRMVYSPDGTTLICESCESRKSKGLGISASSVSEQDFILSISTVKGHIQPTAQLSVECKTCGIVFLMPPHTLSLTCPHCGNLYVVEQGETRQLISPSSIFPALVSKNSAKVIIDDWLKVHDLEPDSQVVDLQGVYFPAWWFSMGGEMNYRYTLTERNGMKEKRWQETGIEPIMCRNIIVPATMRYHKQLRETIAQLDHAQMARYDAGYLANWAAESYQVTITDASLDARAETVKLERKALLSDRIPSNAVNFSMDSHELAVESYQFILIPAWIASFKIANNPRDVFIDALCGEIRTNNPDDNRPWWKRILGGLTVLFV